MKQILLLFFLLFLYSTSTYSQNLIPNPSFEDTVCLYPVLGTPCYNIPFSIQSCCDYWYNPCGRIQIYYNVLNNYYDEILTRVDILGNPNEGVPKNLFSNNTFPRTGNAYTNILAWSYIYYKWDNANDTILYSINGCKLRDCIGIDLKARLLNGKCYKVIFYVTTSNRRTAFVMDGIDVSFSNQSGFSYINWAIQNGVAGDSINHVSSCHCGELNYTYHHFSPPALSTPRGVFF